MPVVGQGLLFALLTNMVAGATLVSIDLISHLFEWWMIPDERFAL